MRCTVGIQSLDDWLRLFTAFHTRRAHLRIDAAGMAAVAQEIHSMAASPSTHSARAYGTYGTYAWLLLLPAFAAALRLVGAWQYEGVVHGGAAYSTLQAVAYAREHGFVAYRRWEDGARWALTGVPVSAASNHDGLVVTALAISQALQWLRLPHSVESLCVYLPPLFAALATVPTWLLAVEAAQPHHRHVRWGGAIAALMLATAPAYLSRSVAGNFDTDALGVLALVLFSWLWIRAVRRGGLAECALSGAAYELLASVYAAKYALVLHLAPLHAIVLVLLGRGSGRLRGALAGLLVVRVAAQGALWAVASLAGSSLWAEVARALAPLLVPIVVVFAGPAVVTIGEGVRVLLRGAAAVGGLGGATQRASQSALLGGRGGWSPIGGAASVLVVLTAAAAAHFFRLAPQAVTAVGARMQQAGLWESGPLYSSMAERQPATWSSFFMELHLAAFLAPAGLFMLLIAPPQPVPGSLRPGARARSAPSDGAVFLILYAMVTVVLSAASVRHMVLLCPAACVLSGLALAQALLPTATAPPASAAATTGSAAAAGGGEKSAAAAHAAKRGAAKHPGPAAPDAPPRRGSGTSSPAHTLTVLCGALGLYLMHCAWAAVSVYGTPPVILSARNPDGSRLIIDDFREAHAWMRANTPEGARVMAWWDHGAQVAALSNRTTLIDGMLRNASQIAAVARAMVSTEEEAFPMLNALGADYVLTVFGGLVGMANDDMNKAVWMIRVAAAGSDAQPHAPPAIVESDYYSAGAYRDFRVDGMGGTALLTSLLYRLTYHRFGDVTTDYARPRGFDRVRNQEIGRKEIRLTHLQEEFTSEHWLVRVYRVLREPVAKASH